MVPRLPVVTSHRHSNTSRELGVSQRASNTSQRRWEYQSNAVTVSIECPAQHPVTESLLTTVRYLRLTVP